MGHLLLGAAILLSSLGTMAGNALAPRLRRTLHEERMIIVALEFPAAAGFAAAVGGDRVRDRRCLRCGFSAAMCRLSFESIVQRDGPAPIGARRSHASRRGSSSVGSSPPCCRYSSTSPEAGFALVAAVFVAAAANYVVGIGRPTGPRDRPLMGGDVYHIVSEKWRIGPVGNRKRPDSMVNRSVRPSAPGPNQKFDQRIR